MKITIVAQRYFPIIGGVETQTRLLCHELSKRHDVQVVAGSFREQRLPKRLARLGNSVLAPREQDFVDEGVQVHALTPDLAGRIKMLPVFAHSIPVLDRFFYQQLHIFGYYWYRLAYEKRLRNILLGSDVVHSVAGGYMGWLGQEVAAQLGIPFVCTPYVHPGQSGSDERSVRYYQNCDIVVALLESDKNQLESLGVPSDRIEQGGVVPLLEPDPDPERFLRKYELGDARIILFIGRMEEYKGAKALIDAAPTVWRQHEDVRFLFAGPGAGNVEAWFGSADRRIQYLGKISDRDKTDALAACTVFSMPSVFEILPAVYLEAWSLGKPVVGGKAKGLPELVEGNRAGIAVSQAPQEIASALCMLLADERSAREFGENGRKLVRNRYELPALVKRHEEIYERACAGSPLPQEQLESMAEF